ncbi:nucleolar zinc-finger protein [Marasmius crinis-equi]|uniref:Nucleolar zinc-finger protein n=1 Tax=Marasmius crinis-equi TaxID=585013 RepID=A0ABR3EZB9_9AGAR
MTFQCLRLRSNWMIRDLYFPRNSKSPLDNAGEDEEDSEATGDGADGSNVNLPYFKDVLIMSTNYDRCGYRDNEVKFGAAISEKGEKDTVQGRARMIRVPAVGSPLEQVYEELSEKVVTGGDSSEESERTAFKTFLSKKEAKSGDRPFTAILDDPLVNSYIQTLCIRNRG